MNVSTDSTGCVLHAYTIQLPLQNLGLKLQFPARVNAYSMPCLLSEA